jgi:hypothetical protein
VTETVQVRPADAKSGATFERFTDAGQRWFRKRLRPERDWVMRIPQACVTRPAPVREAGPPGPTAYSWSASSSAASGSRAAMSSQSSSPSRLS